jgi:hypothetical protein
MQNARAEFNFGPLKKPLLTGCPFAAWTPLALSTQLLADDAAAEKKRQPQQSGGAAGAGSGAGGAGSASAPAAAAAAAPPAETKAAGKGAAPAAAPASSGAPLSKTQQKKQAKAAAAAAAAAASSAAAAPKPGVYSHCLRRGLCRISAPPVAESKALTQEFREMGLEPAAKRSRAADAVKSRYQSMSADVLVAILSFLTPTELGASSVSLCACHAADGSDATACSAHIKGVQLLAQRAQHASRSRLVSSRCCAIVACWC